MGSWNNFCSMFGDHVDRFGFAMILGTEPPNHAARLQKPYCQSVSRLEGCVDFLSSLLRHAMQDIDSYGPKDHQFLAWLNDHQIFINIPCSQIQLQLSGIFGHFTSVKPLRPLCTRPVPAQAFVAQGSSRTMHPLSMATSLSKNYSHEKYEQQKLFIRSNWAGVPRLSQSVGSSWHRKQILLWYATWSDDIYKMNSWSYTKWVLSKSLRVKRKAASQRQTASKACTPSISVTDCRSNTTLFAQSEMMKTKSHTGRITVPCLYLCWQADKITSHKITKH